MWPRGRDGPLVWILTGVMLVWAAGVSATQTEDIVMATYNLWNIMFNWDIRRLRIAQMIKEVTPDVIAFQEVRGHSATGLSQIDDLKRLLPQYRYKHFAMAGSVTPMNNVYKKGWELEGLGLLSRHPIKSTAVYHLTSGQGPDRNRRILLHVTVSVPTISGDLNVIVVHFSYDRVQQCRNAAQLLEYIHDRKLENVVAMGDYNAYSDYEHPIHLLTGSLGDLNNNNNNNNRCPQQYRKPARETSLVDGWRAAHDTQQGLTFSNMPTPGMESRPDRILVDSDRLRVRSASLRGNGTVYLERYYVHVWWARFESWLSAAWDAAQGRTGRACLHDCGPHGSCRCGVCVSGGDQHACLLPDCTECTSGALLLVALALLSLTALSAQLIYALLQVLHAMNRRSPDYYHHTVGGSFMALNCCLCNPRMYSSPTLGRRIRRMWLGRMWPCLRLPPVFLTVVSVVLIFLWLEMVLFVFRDALHDVNSVLAEELFPSDHLMLAVQFTPYQSS